MLFPYCFCLYHAHPCIQCSLGIYNFKRPPVFPILSFSSTSLLCSFKKVFLPLLAILEPCIRFDISFPFFLPFASLLSSAICKASLDNSFAFFCVFFFPLEWLWLLPHVQCYKALSIVLQALCLPDLTP